MRLDRIGYGEILAKDLKVIDSAATSLLRDNAIPTLIFALDPPENILRAVCGEKIGTVVD